VWVPSTVAVISSGFFAAASSLSLVHFEQGSQLSQIEKGAFQDCRLKSICFPASLEIISECIDLQGKRSEIGWNAFSNSGLISIHLPRSVDVIGARCFGDCESLNSVRFAPGSRLLLITTEMFSSANLKRSNCRLASVAIPASVQEIGWGVFAYCTALASCTFEPGYQLLRLGTCAFRYTGLKEIRIPRSVEVIGENCFHDCRSLVRVKFERDSRLSRIETDAFVNNGFGSINVPASVQMICDRCFMHCGSLRVCTFDPASQL
jgi:hypothetical protein